MTNPLVIPNYEHADDIEPQLEPQPTTTSANEDEELQEELRHERESQLLEAQEQE